MIIYFDFSKYISFAMHLNITIYEYIVKTIYLEM